MDGGFHTFDFVIAGIIAVSGILAFLHGFIREVLSIGSWIGAGAIAIAGYPMAREVATAYIPSPLVADIAAGALLFVGAFLILAIIARTISRALESADGLGPINRSFGLLFGLFRGGLIVTVAYLALSWTIPKHDHPGWIADAKLTPLLQESSAMLEQALPEEWQAKGRNAAQQAEEATRTADTVRRLNTPAPTGGDRDASGVYKTDERKALDDLIRKQQ